MTRDPAAAVFSFTDIEHFLEAQNAIADGAESADALQTVYLDRASPGLKMFIEKYDLTTDRLVAAMEKYPDDYARIGEILQALKNEEPSFRETYSKIKDEIPEAVFPPTYFVVAGHRGIGSGSIEGPLISIEKKTPESVRDDLKATLVHEMIHMEQLAATEEAYFAIFSGDERTLLALCVREGAATYFAELIAGGSTHKNLARDYLLLNEGELWVAFQQDMFGHETGDWLWKDPENPDQPRDVGYAMGARIVEAYLANAEDRTQAITEILSVTDYKAFFLRSGYDGSL